MSDESRIDSILGDWRARRDAGEAVSPDEMIAAHPDLADSLRARFDALAAIAAAKRPSLRDVPPERYSDFRVLGQGGMGIVYWALDTDLNRQVAFKIVRPDAGQSGAPTPTAPIELSPPAGDTPASHAFATLKARFLQEAWVTAGLEHPGIVPVYEVGQTPEGVPYYTMRFVKGGRSFAAAIEEVRGKPIDERLALLDPFLKVCDTIRYAHAHGVIHRDLKPDNVALGEFGEVVVLDWGLAKMTGKPDAFAETWQHRLQEYRDAADLKTMASALGTPGYMAPEAARGRTREVDQLSDVYSLGAMLFQILTGRLPYSFATYGELVRAMQDAAPTPPATLDATVPAELSDLCVRALSTRRGARPATVDAFAGEIREWLARRAADREVDALRGQATTALETASELQGDARLHQLDRAASACDQVLARRPDDAAAAALRREIDASRAKGVEERARAVRRRFVRRAAVIGLAASLAGAAAFAWVVRAKQSETESALRTARENLALAEHNFALAHRGSADLAALHGDFDRALVHLAAGRTRAPDVVSIADVQAVQDRRTAPLWSRVAPFSGLHGDVAVSDDGRFVAGFGADRCVVLWDAETGAELARAECGESDRLAVNRDGTVVAIADPFVGLRLWKPRDGAVELRCRDCESKITSLAFVQEGEHEMVVFGDAGGRNGIHVPSVGVGGRREVRPAPVELVAVGAGARAAALAYRDGWIAAFADYDADKTPTAFDARCGRILALGVTADGSTVRAAGADGTLRSWDAKTGAERTRIKIDALTRLATTAPGSAAFSSDGARLAACEETDFSVRDAETGAVVWRSAAGQAGAATRLVFSRDGRRLFCSAAKRTLAVFDASSGSPLGVGARSGGGAWRIAFSPDGRLLAAPGTKDGTIDLHDSVTGAVVRTMSQGCLVLSVSFTPDARNVVAGDEKGAAVVWDVATGARVRSVAAHRGPVTVVAVSPDGRTLVTGSTGHEDVGAARALLAWDLGTGAFRHDFGGRRQGTWSACFAPDGESCLVCSTSLELLNAADGRVVRSYAENLGAGSYATLSPDASRVIAAESGDLPDGISVSTRDEGEDVVAKAGGAVEIWDFATGRSTTRVSMSQQLGHTWGTSVAWLADGARAAFGSDTGLVVWRIQSERELRNSSPDVVRMRPFGQAGCAVAASPDGHLVAMADFVGDLSVFEVRPADELVDLPRSARAFGASGRIVTVEKATVGFVDPASGLRIGGFAGPEDATIFGFDRSGARCVAGGADGSARLLDARDGTATCAFATVRGAVVCAAVSDDGALVVTGHRSGAVVLSIAATGRSVELSRQQSDPPACVAVCSTTGSAAAGGSGGEVDVWTTSKPNSCLMINAHRSRATALAYAPDGATLVVGCEDGSIWLDDAARSRPREFFRRGGPPIVALAVRADGRLLLSCDDEGAAQLWDLASRTEVRRYGAGPGRHVAFSPDGRTALGPTGLLDVESVQACAEARSTWTGTTWVDWAQAETGLRLDGFEVRSAPAAIGADDERRLGQPGATECADYVAAERRRRARGREFAALRAAALVHGASPK